jgi:demethylmenaquinone methyltransferase / 2-methoxy-6-polyprenyl-1,4-benzoquinol methylase
MSSETTSGRRPSLHGMDVEEHLASPAIRQRYVTTMFEIIAPKYDRFTRAFSFGLDRQWKADLIAALGRHVASDARVVDLACGTGDLTVAMAELASAGTVVGIDASPTMIACARTATAARTIRMPPGRLDFQVGDIMALDLPDGSVDAVSVGYGLRNVPDLAAALQEIRRVLKPGGILGNLDFVLPEPGLWRVLLLTYLKLMGDLYGWWYHGDAQVYGYIARSIRHFVTRRQLDQALTAAGFTVLEGADRLLGGVSMQVARRDG